MVVPPFHTPKWSFLVGKAMVVGETHHFRSCPHFKRFPLKCVESRIFPPILALFQVKESNDFRREVPVPKMGRKLKEDHWKNSGGFPTATGWWFQIFFMFTPKIAEIIYFDEHIFQMGWFNHQPGKLGNFVKHIKSSERFLFGKGSWILREFCWSGEDANCALPIYWGTFGHLSELVFL